jgi:hypothetical protein
VEDAAMAEVKPRTRGQGSLSDGQRPWPRITSADGRPDCHYCSWAWYGPRGRMEVKYLNAMCWKHPNLSYREILPEDHEILPSQHVDSLA